MSVETVQLILALLLMAAAAYAGKGEVNIKTNKTIRRGLFAEMQKLWPPPKAQGKTLPRSKMRYGKPYTPLRSLLAFPIAPALVVILALWIGFKEHERVTTMANINTFISEGGQGLAKQGYELCLRVKLLESFHQPFFEQHNIERTECQLIYYQTSK